ncbi:hypothetical protein FKP32DRAFT_1681013 [Trametes sanguinea]|nr:hypothetical protein FKP32DRAFT_1681013 [Trametes sanguinea]
MHASIVPHQTHSVLESIPTNSLPSTAQTPPRPRPAHGTENVPVQPPPTPWDEDSEEGRAVHHFGIEDSDADLEKEEFDSIPGYDEFSVEEDESNEPRSFCSTSKAPVQSRCRTDVSRWALDAGDADADSVDGHIHGDSAADESSCSSDPESDSDSDSDSTADTDSSVDAQHASSAEDSDSPAHRFVATAEEDDAYEAGEDAEGDASDGSEYHGSAVGACSRNLQAPVRVSDGGDNGLQQALTAEDEDVTEYSALPGVRPLRRSTRLQAATKRQREESPDSEGFESSSRPAKRRNLRISKGGASVHLMRSDRE